MFVAVLLSWYSSLYLAGITIKILGISITIPLTEIIKILIP